MNDIQIKQEKIYEFFEYIRRTYSKKEIIGAIITATVLVSIALCIFFTDAPSNFPTGIVFSVEKGMTLDAVSHKLKESHLIRSQLLFKIAVRYGYGGDENIIAGEYYFPQEATPFSIARMMTEGEYGLTPLAVTIPEGLTTFEIAELLDAKLPTFNAPRFRKLAAQYEGYLFPDTYFFVPNISEEEIIAKMKGTFDERIEELREDLEKSPYTLEEIVVMASLLEKEARLTTTRQKIAGILWKRLEIDMPLQVDAVFPYIIGKNTYQLTVDDLDYDSPYNTYKYTGLPKGPIANPGLDSLWAALNPISSQYLFYLADRNGTTHYSRTFEEHKQTKALYLN